MMVSTFLFEMWDLRTDNRDYTKVGLKPRWELFNPTALFIVWGFPNQPFHVHLYTEGSTPSPVSPSRIPFLLSQGSPSGAPTLLYFVCPPARPPLEIMVDTLMNLWLSHSACSQSQLCEDRAPASSMTMWVFWTMAAASEFLGGWGWWSIF